MNIIKKYFWPPPPPPQKTGYHREDKVFCKQTRAKWNDNTVYKLYKLQEASRFWEFEKLSMGEMTIEHKLIHLRLIDDMFNASYKDKILEQLHLSKSFCYS